MPQWGIFFGRDIPWAYGLAVTASACAPWAGLVLCDRCACSGSLLPPQQAVLVPHGAQTAVPSKTSNKKYPAASCEVFCGAPCGSKPEHFYVSGRHWHHAAAHPEVMPVVPPREDKRGVLKHQGAFAAYPRFANWAAVFHSPLDISPSLFFRLIAEQPTSPYPGGITESKSKHGTCLVQ